MAPSSHDIKITKRKESKEFQSLLNTTPTYPNTPIAIATSSPMYPLALHNSKTMLYIQKDNNVRNNRIREKKEKKR